MLFYSSDVLKYKNKNLKKIILIYFQVKKIFKKYHVLQYKTWKHCAGLSHEYI